MDDDVPGRGSTALAYAIAALTTLLWVACVLPAGPLPPPSAGARPFSEDLATPLHREAWVLVPALVLLVVGPVGVVLAQHRVGRLAVLAGTDAFIAGYAGIALGARGVVRGDVSLVLVALLLGIAVISVLETIRVLRAPPEADVRPLGRGLRFALCLLALITPSGLLVRDGRELASLLAPFALVAIGAGGATLARGALGLRLTASIVHLALALHVLVTVRFTIYEAEPAVLRVEPPGAAALGLAVAVAVLAFAQTLLLRRTRRQMALGSALTPAGR